MMACTLPREEIRSAPHHAGAYVRNVDNLTGDVDGVVAEMADPEGNEFCLLRTRLQPLLSRASWPWQQRIRRDGVKESAATSAVATQCTYTRT
jgi:hypothetical protein